MKNFIRKCFLIIGLIIFSFNNSNSQDYTKSIKITKALLEENICKVDSGAGAWVLAESGKVNYNYVDGEGFTMYYTHHVIIKIVKNTEFQQGTFIIPIYNFGSGWERLNTKGITYHLEGNEITKTKLGKESQFEEIISSNQMNIKIAMPGIREGSIIDFEYSISSKYLDLLRDWFFQRNIPVIHSYYVTEFPEYYKFKKFLNGYITVETKEEQSEINQNISSAEREGDDYLAKSNIKNEVLKYNILTSTYNVSNVPAFKEEPFLSSSKNYISFLENELESAEYKGRPSINYTKNWTSVTKELLNHEKFGMLLKNSNFLKPIVNTLTKDLTTSTDKATAIYKYLHNYMKWNGKKGLIANNSIKKAFENKSGNAAEINLLLILMLQEAGIQSDPLILSTRDNGIAFLQYPILSKFNYVIACAWIDGKPIAIDATDPFIAFGKLPERCINGSGMTINEGNNKEISLNIKESSSNTSLLQLAFNESEMVLKGKFQQTFKGYSGTDQRKEYASASSKDEYIKNIQTKNVGLSINKFDIKGLDNLEAPLQIICDDIKITDLVQSAGDVYTINPMLFKQNKENEFKSENRIYPVDFIYNRDENYILSIDIPQGYTIDEMPKSSILVLADNSAKYSYQIAKNNNKVQLTVKFQIIKTFYDPIEYQKLREFFQKLIELEKQLIVIKKEVSLK